MQYLHYASYGSNLHPTRFGERIPSAVHLGQSFLPGYSLRFYKRSNIDGSGKCSIANPGPGVHIAVYRMDAAHKTLLDEIEGLGKGYADLTVETADFGECFTYTATATHIDDTLAPLDWYKEIVRLGAIANGLPDDYVARIGNVPSVFDPQEIRRTEQWALVESLRTSQN